jgi:hypothetical protein
LGHFLPLQVVFFFVSSLAAFFSHAALALPVLPLHEALVVFLAAFFSHAALALPVLPLHDDLVDFLVAFFSHAAFALPVLPLHEAFFPVFLVSLLVHFLPLQVFLGFLGFLGVFGPLGPFFGVFLGLGPFLGFVLVLVFFFLGFAFVVLGLDFAGFLDLDLVLGLDLTR